MDGWMDRWKNKNLNVWMDEILIRGLDGWMKE